MLLGLAGIGLCAGVGRGFGGEPERHQGPSTSTEPGPRTERYRSSSVRRGCRSGPRPRGIR